MPVNGNVFSDNYPDLSIYVTHGGTSTIKGIARRCNPKKTPYLLATYKNSRFSLVNREQFALCLGCELDQIPNGPCSMDDFIKLIDWVKTQSFAGLPGTMLFVDPNLGTEAGHEISEPFFELVGKIAPKFLFACSGTPKCVEKVEKYLLGEAVVINAQEHRLPKAVKITGAADQNNIALVIESAFNSKIDTSQINVESCMTIEKINNIEEAERINTHDECSSQVAQCSDSDSQNRSDLLRTCQYCFLSCLSFFRPESIQISPESCIVVNNNTY